MSHITERLAEFIFEELPATEMARPGATWLSAPIAATR
jgi:hypothetical protein